ncbi:MAG: rod shape-determining protein MreC [Firmicutes bacterium]|nr:rod shape-determining protein MreC [Bacillota bacterium]
MGKKKAWVLLGIAVLSIVIILFQSRSFRQGEAGPVSKVFSYIAQPVQTFFSNTGKNISAKWRSITHSANLEAENRKLEAEIYTLKEEQETYNRTRDENENLRKLLELSKVQQGRIIAAEVIARDPDNWFRFIKVNKGSRNQVKVNMSAITPEGIVGRVVSVSDNTARIMLIFDEKSAIPAQVVSSGALGVVYGEGKNTCIMKYIENDAQVNTGDKVITSHLSRIYPPGKIIGEVTKVYGRDNILYKAVQIKPAVEFGRLQYVLLLEQSEQPAEPESGEEK